MPPNSPSRIRLLEVMIAAIREPSCGSALVDATCGRLSERIIGALRQPDFAVQKTSS